MSIWLCDEELEALAEGSLEAMRLYVLGIRPAMDVKTQLAGRGFSLSRAILCCNIQYTPPHGSRRAPWKPTPKQLDSLIDELVRLGLVVRASTVQDYKKLVLRLPKAYVRPLDDPDMSRIPRAGHDAETQSPASKGFEGMSRQHEPDMSRQHEPDISKYQRKEEMRCAGAQETSEESPVDTPVADQPAALSATWHICRRAFVEALGGDYRQDAATMRALSRLRAVVAQRDVHRDELLQAVAVARGKQVGAVAAYAVSIVESGSLLAQRRLQGEGGVRQPAGRRQAFDVLDVLAEGL